MFLIVARAGQGVGGAIMFATSLALIAQAFHGRDGRWRSGCSARSPASPSPSARCSAALLTSGLSWRWIFFVNIPVGIAALIVTLRKVEESRNPFARRPDVPGFLTFSTGLAALTYGLIRSAPDGWGSTTVVVSLTAAAALLAAFVVVERCNASRCSTWGWCASRRSTAALLAALAINGVAVLAADLPDPLLRADPRPIAAQTGVRFLPLTGAIFVASGIAGRLSEKVPARMLIAPGFALVGGGLLLMRGVSIDSTWTHLLPG